MECCWSSGQFGRVAASQLRCRRVVDNGCQRLFGLHLNTSHKNTKAQIRTLCGQQPLHSAYTQPCITGHHYTKTRRPTEGAFTPAEVTSEVETSDVSSSSRSTSPSSSSSLSPSSFRLAQFTTERCVSATVLFSRPALPPLQPCSSSLSSSRSSSDDESSDPSSSSDFPSLSLPLFSSPAQQETLSQPKRRCQSHYKQNLPARFFTGALAFFLSAAGFFGVIAFVLVLVAVARLTPLFIISVVVDGTAWLLNESFHVAAVKRWLVRRRSTLILSRLTSERCPHSPRQSV